MPATATKPAAKPTPAAAPEPTTYPNLIAALAAFQANLPSVRKNQTADVQGREGRRGYSYDYADLTDVSEEVLPDLAAVGLAFHTGLDTVDGNIVLRWELAHAHSDDKRAGMLPVGRAGGNWQDIGASITYARRYALTAATGVAPGGDDNDAAGGVAAGAARAEAPTQRPVQRPAEVQYLPAGIYDLGSVTTVAEAEKMFYTARRAGHLNLMIQADGQDVAFGAWLQALGEKLGKPATPPAAEEDPDAAAVAAHEAELAAAESAGEANG